MSTQQQIQAWQQAIDQKKAERTALEKVLPAQLAEVERAENARADAEVAVIRARNAGAPPAQIQELQAQVVAAGQAETRARTAADTTQTNIEKVDGSIRYNTAQRDLYQGKIPNQANGASTVGDRPANARTDAAEVEPAPQPVQSAAAPVPPSQQGNNRDFVEDPNTGELVPADSAQAEAIRAEQNRVQTRAPVSAIEEGGEEEAQRAQAARPEPVDDSDPFEAARIAREQENNALFEEGNESLTLSPEEVGEEDPFEARRLELEQEANREEFAAENFPPEPGTGDEDPAVAALDEQSRAAAEADAENFAPQPVEDVKYDEFGNVVPNTPEEIAAAEAKAAEQQEAEAQAAAKLAAINQATLQSLYKAVGSTDWRVRLQLAPTSNYLYNAGNNGKLDGSAAGILAPLTATNGVIFPYTPQIQTTYQARYTDYDLVHSNFRGIFYQSSRVDDINIRAEFTAQDTNEANYLLAVIHFFRSVTKMFYGKDTERGTPPPLVYLSGLGMNQFYGHPCLVRSFQYALPNNVDYIRATTVNNYGTDLLNRRNASSPSSVAGLGATGNRILNAGLEKFFPSSKPVADAVVASVNNTQLANYVPTKMEIDIVLIPVQTRSQASKQFSLKGFANGDLIKGGFW